MAASRVAHVVVDTVAFFKNVQLQDIAENIYTTEGVVSEIKDAATRQRLAVLPYDLKYRDPSHESIQIVSDFAKKTGDYRSLSAVDIKLLALAVHLTKEHCGLEHLKLVPEKKVTLVSNTRPLVKATDIVGFYLPPKDSKHYEDKDEAKSTFTSESSFCTTEVETEDIELTLNKLDVRDEADGENAADCGSRRDESVEKRQGNHEASVDERTDQISDRPQEALKLLEEEIEVTTETDDLVRPSSVETGDLKTDVEEEEFQDDNEDEELEGDWEASDDDDEGWITPENIARIKQSPEGILPDETVTVGCMTADFAMQNILIQMGIPVLSVEGMLIKTAKSFVLRCRACFKITKVLTKVFCPFCGNKTLDKVTVTTDEDGNQRIHLSHRKVINKRGLKYPLPQPKGGKHSDNPILVEDQPIPHNRLSHKAQMKTDIFNTDYIVGSSPFAPKDTTSKSAQLGVRSFMSNAAHHRRNPNQVRPKRGRKK